MSSTKALSDIRNFVEIDRCLATSGQPSEAQLATAAQAGFELVINLALHDDPRYSLSDEAGTVHALGMKYVHIPVQYRAPTERDMLVFFKTMDANLNRKTLVHCAANIRVSAFLGLYRAIRQAWPIDKAFALYQQLRRMEEQRNKGRDKEAEMIWTNFIDQMLAAHGAAPSS